MSETLTFAFCCHRKFASSHVSNAQYCNCNCHCSAARKKTPSLGIIAHRISCARPLTGVYIRILTPMEAGKNWQPLCLRREISSWECQMKRSQKHFPLRPAFSPLNSLCFCKHCHGICIRVADLVCLCHSAPPIVCLSRKTHPKRALLNHVGFRSLACTPCTSTHLRAQQALPNDSRVLPSVAPPKHAVAHIPDAPYSTMLAPPSRAEMHLSCEHSSKSQSRAR